MKILFSMSKGDVNSPKGDLLVADKLDALIQITQNRGFDFSTLIRDEKAQTLSRIAYRPTLNLRTSLSNLKEAFSEFFANLERHPNIILHRRNFRYVLRKSAWKTVIRDNQITTLVGIGLDRSAIDAARDLGVQSIEVQHGAFGTEGAKKHWGKYPPDVLLTWNFWFAGQARKFVEDVRVIGHPISQKFSQEQEEETTAVSDDIAVCVALQYKRWGFFVLPNVGADLLEVLVQNASVNKERLIFRLHPIIDSRPVRKMLQIAFVRYRFPKSQIHEPQKTSLYESIKSSKALITEASSTAYEFGLLGRPSLILDMTQRAKFEELFVASGMDTSLILRDEKSLSKLIQIDFQEVDGFDEEVFLELLKNPSEQI
jgi:hypothetical protein